jgi:hypothetical protein
MDRRENRRHLSAPLLASRSRGRLEICSMVWLYAAGPSEDILDIIRRTLSAFVDNNFET